jgi:hypothetical protein
VRLSNCTHSSTTPRYRRAVGRARLFPGWNWADRAQLGVVSLDGAVVQGRMRHASPPPGATAKPWFRGDQHAAGRSRRPDGSRRGGGRSLKVSCRSRARTTGGRGRRRARGATEPTCTVRVSPTSSARSRAVAAGRRGRRRACRRHVMRMSVDRSARPLQAQDQAPVVTTATRTFPRRRTCTARSANAVRAAPSIDSASTSASTSSTGGSPRRRRPHGAAVAQVGPRAGVDARRFSTPRLPAVGRIPSRRRASPPLSRAASDYSARRRRRSCRPWAP